MKMSSTNIPSSSSTNPFTYDLAVVGLCNNYTSFTVDIDSGGYGGWAVNPTVTDRVYGLSCGQTSGRIVTAQIYGNNNASTRSFTLKVSGSTTDGKTCTKDLSFTQDGKPAATCPASGDVIHSSSTRTINGCAGTYSGALQFKTGDTNFSSVDSVTCDGTVITSAYFGNDTQSGYKLVVLNASENPSTSQSREGSVTITMNATAGGQCVYTIPITQSAKGTCSSTFAIDYINNTGVKIGDGTGYTYDSGGNVLFNFAIHALENGHTLRINVDLGSMDSKVVASAKARVHTEGGGGSAQCKTVGGTIVGATLRNGLTYTFQITNNAC
jgi:hypothetical protein